MIHCPICEERLSRHDSYKQYQVRTCGQGHYSAHKPDGTMVALNERVGQAFRAAIRERRVDASMRCNLCPIEVHGAGALLDHMVAQHLPEPQNVLDDVPASPPPEITETTMLLRIISRHTKEAGDLFRRKDKVAALERITDIEAVCRILRRLAN